jgi:hypothetical protein
MNKTFKLIGIAAAALVVLALVLVFSLDSMIRRGVETVGSHSLGVEVKLRRAHLSLLRGRLTFSGLTIANPDGFKTDTLFSAESASVAIRPGALLEDELTITDIALVDPSVTIEQSSGGTNLSKLFENIDTGAPAETTEAEPEAPKEEKTYRIKKLKISGAKVTFSSFLPGKEPMTVSLPVIEMNDMSSKDGTGLILAQVIKQVLTKMLTTGVTEGQGTISQDAMREITGNLQDLAPDIQGDALDQTKGVMEKATSAVKGLFGR